jgi:hypothetical protein
MYNYQNAIAQNNPGHGNVVEGFNRLKNLISVNDAARKFTPRVTTCHDQQAPFDENELTYLSITHRDHHVSHISDGYIHMIIELTLILADLHTSPFAIDDPDNLCKIFVGLKDSNQIFHQMWIRNRNQGTGYEQSEMCREGFAISVSKHGPLKQEIPKI